MAPLRNAGHRQPWEQQTQAPTWKAITNNCFGSIQEPLFKLRVSFGARHCICFIKVMIYFLGWRLEKTEGKDETKQIGG